MRTKMQAVAATVVVISMCVVSRAQDAPGSALRPEIPPESWVRRGLASPDELLMRVPEGVDTDRLFAGLEQMFGKPEHVVDRLWVLPLKPTGTSIVAARSSAVAGDATTPTMQDKVVRYEAVVKALERIPTMRSAKEVPELFRDVFPNGIRPFIVGGKPAMVDWTEYAVEASPYATIAAMNIDEKDGFAKQCGLKAINAEKAWKTITDARRVNVAIVDSGLAKHSDLEYATPATEFDADRHGHGTHVAGIIGASKNGTGVIGVTWRTNITAYQFLDGSGRGTLPYAIKKIRAAIDGGAHIVVLPWGVGIDLPEFKQLLEDHENTVLFVAAAGNTASDIEEKPIYPAAYELDNVISVMATTCDDRRARFSNYGAPVDLAAPGEGLSQDVRIFSTALNQRWGNSAGTSMAAAFVAGAAALVRQRSLELNPGNPYTPKQIKDWLRHTAVKLPDPTTQTKTSQTTMFRLDLAAAVALESGGQ